VATRSAVIQSSFLSGVLDPRAKARVETEAYNNGLLAGVNVVPDTLGGLKRRHGTQFIQRLPNVLGRVIPAIATAPNGGTAANAHDDNEATVVTTAATIGTTNPYVIVHYDLGVPMSILYADVIGISISAGTSTEFWVQCSTDNATWLTVGNYFQAVDYQDVRSYRRAGPVSAQYWRVAKAAGTDLGFTSATIKNFTLWTDTGSPSEARVIPLEVSTEDRYAVVLTDRTASIFNGDTFVAAVPTLYPSADLADVDAASNAETLTLVHEGYPPYFLLRESVTNFQSTPIVFDVVPDHDFNDTLSPVPVIDTQVITLAGAWVQGAVFQIDVEGARTAAIVYAGDATAEERATTAANIAREVQKVYTVRGFTGVSCVRTGTGAYTLFFAGASAKDYKLVSVASVTGGGTATVAKTTEGTSRREPAWSATRGYPRTVTFFEGRLYFGGTRSLQQTLFGSRVNDPLNFDIGEGLADEAIVVTLNGQQLNAINGVYGSRSLQVFTSGTEMRYAKQAGAAVEPSDAPVTQTQYGSAKIRPVAIDGATLYVQRNRKSVRDFKYNYEEDAFDSLGVSSLAPHLLNDITDMFAWNGTRTDEIGLVFVVNGDGTMAVLNSRKEAGVQAWVQWTTAGLFKAGAAIVEDVYLAVERNYNGTRQMYFEQLDSARYTDCSTWTAGGYTVLANWLGHLEGNAVRVLADTFVLETQTVVGGAITLERASLDVEIGLNFNPQVTPMPLNTMNPGGWPTVMRKRRVVKVRAKVQNTLGLLCNGRVLEDRAFDIDLIDAPLAPFSGNYTIEETTNWDDSGDKLVTFSQVDPLPMNILGIDVTMESE